MFALQNSFLLMPLSFFCVAGGIHDYVIPTGEIFKIPHLRSE